MSLLMGGLETRVPISVTVNAKRKSNQEANLDHRSISFAHFLILLEFEGQGAELPSHD